MFGLLYVGYCQLWSSLQVST